MIKTILASIQPKDNETSQYEAIVQRLVSFGYIPTLEDGWMIQFAFEKTQNKIKNSCNTSSIPDGLLNVFVDMVCGEFLQTKKQLNKLQIDTLDFSGAISSIKEGDVQVNFASGTSDEEKFNFFLNHLLHDGEGEFVCYRKLAW